MIDDRQQVPTHRAGPAPHNELLVIEVLVEDPDTKAVG